MIQLNSSPVCREDSFQNVPKDPQQTTAVIRYFYWIQFPSTWHWISRLSHLTRLSSCSQCDTRNEMIIRGEKSCDRKTVDVNTERNKMKRQEPCVCWFVYHPWKKKGPYLHIYDTTTATWTTQHITFMWMLIGNGKRNTDIAGREESWETWDVKGQLLVAGPVLEK